MAVKMDTHIHTSFSTDSETDMQEQILTSYKKGLEGICITDHMDYNFPESALEHSVDGIPSVLIWMIILSVFIHCKRLHHSLSIPVWSVVCSLLLM